MHKKEWPETAPEEFAANGAESRSRSARRLVCGLPPGPALPVPAWAAGEEFVSITRTPDELSIVCSQNGVPEGSAPSGISGSSRSRAARFRFWSAYCPGWRARWPRPASAFSPVHFRH